jgi:Cu(I)/Ag(I) efflux system periplasmic protein CusF
MSRMSLADVPERLCALVLLLSLLVGTAPGFAQTPLADRRVVKIDEGATGKITIKQGALKQFGMDEGVTMVYRAADPAMLMNLKPGDKSSGAPDRVNGRFTVTKIENVR